MRNPFKRLEIAALDIEILADGHEPVRILRKRTQQLHALPGRKRSGRRVGGSADKIHLAVEHELGALLGVVDKLDIDAFFFEEAEVNGGDGDKIGWGIEIGDPNLEHAATPDERKRSKWTPAKASPILGARFKLIERCAAMCFFCIGDDTPFHLRKSAVFPRKMVAEAVEPGSEAAPSEPGVLTAFICDSPKPEPSPSVWPKRKGAPSRG